MTAPQSCWIEWNDENEEAEFFHTSPTGGPKDVRYLRSDLTCGECRDIAKCMDGISGAKDFVVDDAAPACMEFVPLPPNQTLYGSGK